MAFRTRVWSVGKVVLLIAALGATYLVSAAASMQLALKTREVHVPNLTKHTANEASTMLADVGLTLKVDDSRRVDPRIPPGQIIAQEPAARSTARRQRSVRVWLSLGPRVAAVPALAGETERTAELRLAQNGLTLAAVSEVRSGSYPSDVVIAQEPPARSGGATVALLINRGNPGTSYVMPDLIGANGERVADVLRGRGFRVTDVGSTPYPGVAPGIVIRQTPQAGVRVTTGEPIRLEVSR